MEIPFIIGGLYLTNCIRPHLMVLQKTKEDDFKYGLFYRHHPTDKPFYAKGVLLTGRLIYPEPKIFRYIKSKKDFQLQAKEVGLMFIRNYA